MNERGAISILGLGAGLSLVGSIWWVFGIGKAMLLHDRLQETADAVTFAASTVHARGMNILATINLVMLILVAIFVTLGLILDVIRLILISLAVCVATVFGAPVCGPMIPPVQTAQTITSNIRDRYEDVMKPTLRALGYAETAVAIVT